MAYFKFTDKILKGETIQIYNHGDMYRDFTYIDDIVTGIVNVMEHAPEENEEGVKYKVYNIGNNKPESLMRFVEILEDCLKAEGMITSLLGKSSCQCSREMFIRLTRISASWSGTLVSDRRRGWRMGLGSL